MGKTHMTTPINKRLAPIRRALPKARPSKPADWRGLSLELLAYWCSLWKLRDNHNSIAMGERALGKIFGKNRSTICRVIRRLRDVDVVHVVNRTKDEKPSIITFTMEPPAGLGQRPFEDILFRPPVRQGTGGEAVDSVEVATPCTNAPFTTTTDNVNNKPVNINVNVNRIGNTDTGNGASTHGVTTPSAINDLTPSASSHTAGLEVNVAAAEQRPTASQRAQLKELQDELAFWEKVKRPDLVARCRTEIEALLKGTKQ